MIRVLIVDDEPLARRRLERLLHKHGNIHIVGQARNGVEAVRQIQSTRPHIVFLDVQMPDLDGLGVIAEVGPDNMPLTVFVTAYDQYALAAFDANAVDYLLKPFEDQRFEQALARTFAQRQNRETPAAKLHTLLEQMKPASRLRRFAVHAKDRVYFVGLEDIQWFSAEGPYVALHTSDGKTHLIRDSIKRLETQLDPNRYLRIHRGTLVDGTCIEALYPRGNRAYDVVMKDGTPLKLSRTYKDAVTARLGL